jgi:hypothetical protein
MSDEYLLRWRPEEDQSEEDLPEPCHALRPVPHDNRGFFEKRRYIVAKPHPGMAFYIDDEPLAD